MRIPPIYAVLCVTRDHPMHRLTSSTENSRIFCRYTVMISKPAVPTLSEVHFISIAVDIVQHNKTSSRSKVRGLCCSCSWYRNMPKQRLHMQVILYRNLLNFDINVNYRCCYANRQITCITQCNNILMHSSQLQLACKNSSSTHQLYYSLAVCTPLLHHCCPNHHHTLFPTLPCSRTLHGHSLVIYHQPVELFHQRILKTHKKYHILICYMVCIPC